MLHGDDVLFVREINIVIVKVVVINGYITVVTVEYGKQGKLVFIVCFVYM